MYLLVLKFGTLVEEKSIIHLSIGFSLDRLPVFFPLKPFVTRYLWSSLLDP